MTANTSFNAACTMMIALPHHVDGCLLQPCRGGLLGGIQESWFVVVQDGMAGGQRTEMIDGVSLENGFQSVLPWFTCGKTS